MNVLFITADQWRGDCLSALGHPCVRTPNLDRLGEQGVTFTAHYCQASPCGPSRASLHTGLYMMNHRSVNNGTPLDRRHVNWAQLLRGAGWDPVLFGYSDTSADPRDYPPDHVALKTYEGILPGLRSLAHVNLGDARAWAEFLAGHGYPIPSPPEQLYRSKSTGVEWEDGGAAPLPLAIRAEHHDTHFVTDRAIAFIRETTHKPWCVHLSLLRPHPPWLAPAPYNAMYSPDTLPGYVRAETAAAEAATHPWLAAALATPALRAPTRAGVLARLQASYYGLMTEVDDNLGRLFGALRDAGQWDDTLVIFTSDHGEQMGDHHLLGKSGYFDEAFHVPLIIRDPHATRRHGSRVTRFTEHVDLMPTLLNRLSLEMLAHCDGRSLQPFLESTVEPAGWRDAAYWEYDFRDAPADSAFARFKLPLDACSLSVIRDNAFKYVHFAGLPPLLFDLTRDPAQLDNRAIDADYTATALEYSQRLLSLRMRNADRSMTHLYLGRDGVRRRV
ncbi:MAG: alkaline phosphatase family protein [Gammaproteobacteria bacterium]|nr:alkaline phosphatase family protein [Gammaproteobacteria bacterium]